MFKISGKIFLIGIGTTERELTLGALEAINIGDIFIGYEEFIRQAQRYFKKSAIIIDDQKLRSNINENEELMIRRAEVGVNEALNGKIVIFIYGGDYGIYTPATYVYYVANKKKFTNIECIAGIPHFLSAASCIGTPIAHGFALFSLFDRRTKEDYVLKRIELAAKADFVMVIYLPLPEATILQEFYPKEKYHDIYPLEEKVRYRYEALYSILTNNLDKNTPVSIVKTSFNNNIFIKNICLEDLITEFTNKTIDYLTTLIIGNSSSMNLSNNVIINTFSDGKIVNL